MKNFANWASLLCLVHCTVLPIVLIFLPTSAIYLMLDSKFEFILLTLSCVLNIYNICFGIKTHRKYNIIWFFSAGLVLMLLGYFLNGHKHTDHSQINVLMILGSFMLIISNIINNKVCRLCKSCNMESKNE
jgi:hypothetical protein